MSLINHLKNYKEQNFCSFHMPGHKGNPDFFPKEPLYSFDYTEIPGMDNLFNPTSVLLELEEKIGKIFGAKKSVISTNGSTGGLLAGILYAAGRGNEIIAARNCHKSVYSGILLSGAKPRYIYPEMTEFGVFGGVLPETVEAAVKKYPKATAVVITSPTFEGFVSDIKAISKITNAYKKILIVDEAHGAHFPFSVTFPKSAVHYADIVVTSLHKTLPVLTQLSCVHLNEKIDGKIFRDYLSFVNTSSPSYLFMAQADFCFDKILDKKLWDDYLVNLKKFHKNCAEFDKITLIGNNYKNKYGVFDVDISRLVFLPKISGEIFYNALMEQKIQLEYFGLNHAVGISSCADTENSFSRLFEALKKVTQLPIYNIRNIDSLNSPNFPKIRTNSRFSLMNALQNEGIRVKMEYSLNRVSKRFIIPYPPGVPLLCPGEEITEEALLYIESSLKSGREIMGIDIEAGSVFLDVCKY